MKKILNRLVATSAALLCLTTAACQKDPVESEGKGNVEIWTAYGTEKILRDLDYSSRYGDDTLSINAFRNEYESAQIIISPEKSVGEYTLTLSDLTNGNGETLSKDSFTVYNQKYINVTDIKDAESQTGAGYYPDALLPYEAAVSHGENKITEGKNQGLWITLKAGKEQPAGTYQGNFKLTVDGTDYQVPVKVTVFDYTLSDEVHSKSSFLVNADELALGELDATNEMIEAYHDFFLDHRISPNHLSSGDLYGVLEDEALEAFLDAAQKASEDVRCSNYHITYAMSSATISVDGKDVSIQTVDYTLFESTLRAMLDRSMETGVNLFKKAATYFVFFDEYDVNNKTESANYNLKMSAELCESLANEFRDAYGNVAADFRTEVLDDLAGIRHKCVGSLTSNLTSKATMVPTIDKYHTAEGRKLYSDWAEKWYGEDGELWTYTCMNPDPPYPTYHTEDVLISSRLMGWMMYNYNITGNLYWCTTLYAYSDGHVTSGQLQDYYDKALRFPQANGDGYLVYPGRQYGIKGPVGTVRLQSIRDGNEDYDLLYQLEQEFYKERGVSGEQFDNVLKYLVQDLYNGTRCNTDKEICELFAQARLQLASMIALADKTGTIVENAVTSSGKTTFTLSAPEGVALEVNGNALTEGVTENGVTKYTLFVALDQDVNSLNVKATKDGKSYSLSLSLGGKIVESGFVTFNDKITLRTETSTKETVELDGVSIVKLSDVGNELSAQFDAASLNVNEKAKTVTLRIYADRQTQLDLRGKCEKHSAYVKVTDVTLQEGWNEVVIDVYTLNCAQNGVLQGLRFNFTSEEGVSVGLGSVIVAAGGR